MELRRHVTGASWKDVGGNSEIVSVHQSVRFVPRRRLAGWAGSTRGKGVEARPLSLGPER